ncbi:GNAT family N-acetyltransferase [Cohnella silvisoli]|uniref:GNAT family N-acetyltransferase n=1 Tax=Cohnella silvisoli TaxID=2873699 RepID=A0ABV1KY57_9BACL|nr:GNAT family N-acetyltransferase [Cohnella silvisoli]MCD9021842.1 GNAT family N-acetyltransferase [Cohnella silvisoli]
MLLNIKSKLEDTTIMELIELATYPDPEHVTATINEYNDNPELELKGYYLGDQVIGIIGYRMNANSILELRHIAVLPEERLHGFGRGMILDVLSLNEPKEIITETDETAINFYRNIGFTIESLGEKYPGVERFKCTYVAEIED